jgi:hypothetical protein
MSFLEAWNEAKAEQAKKIAGFLASGSKEKIGAMFLLDPRSVHEKEEDFRRRLPGDSDWFADFLIGEQHLISGYKQDALEAYKHSYESIMKMSKDNRSNVDKLLIRQIISRLYSLEILNNPKKGISSGEAGD